MNGFLRHIAACNNARLPGGRVVLQLGSADVGWLAPGIADALAARDGVERRNERIVIDEPVRLPELARTLSEDGWFRWRGEAFDVRASADSPVLTTIDRGALPAFGIMASGVHVNGLVHRADGLHLWVGYRANDKPLDPGKLDHVVAGGISAGMTAMDTLIKEAGEEAAIPPSLAAAAVPVGRITYAMERREGLRRDCLYCYDLALPDNFSPHPADGEMERFELWPLARAFAAVRDGDDFKFNVALVLIDLFARLGLISGADAATIRAALTPVP